MREDWMQDLQAYTCCKGEVVIGCGGMRVGLGGVGLLCCSNIIIMETTSLSHTQTFRKLQGVS